MEWWHRLATAAACLLVVAAVTMAVWWPRRHARFSSSLEDIAPSEPNPAPLRKTPQEYADAITLRTLELIKTQQQLQAAQQRWNEEVRRRAELALENERLRRQIEELRKERNESIELALLLLQESLVPSETPPPEMPDPASTARNVEGAQATEQPLNVELLTEIERLQVRLNESQEALAAMLDRAAATDQALVQQHNRIVQATIRVARQANTHAVVAALVAELQSPYAEVRRWAARTLEALGPDAHDAIDALEALLADSDASVQQAAQAALRAIRD